MLFKFILSFVILGIVTSCTNKESVPEWNYFPLKMGEYRIYDVSENIHTAGNDEIKSFRHEEKHVVTKIELESSNNIIKAEISVYRRPDHDSSWHLNSIYALEKRPDQVLLTKDSYTFVPLEFPINNGKIWDGNIYNSLEKISYSITEINKPFKDWENTIKVLKREKSTLIDHYNSFQLYANGIGLVYDEDTAYEYCQDDACIGQYKIESGYSKSYLLIEYGDE